MKYLRIPTNTFQLRNGIQAAAGGDLVVPQGQRFDARDEDLVTAEAGICKAGERKEQREEYRGASSHCSCCCCGSSFVAGVWGWDIKLFELPGDAEGGQLWRLWRCGHGQVLYCNNHTILRPIISYLPVLA